MGQNIKKDQNLNEENLVYLLQMYSSKSKKNSAKQPIIEVQFVKELFK